MQLAQLLLFWNNENYDYKLLIKFILHLNNIYLTKNKFNIQNKYYWIADSVSVKYALM
jgi:hypothetical protein